MRYNIDENHTIQHRIERNRNIVKIKLLLLLLIIITNSVLAKQIDLTREEKEFIENNTLKVGVEQWKPAIYSNDGTDIDGVTGDFLKEIIRYTGLKVKIVNDKWTNIISDLENKTIDIIPATYYTKNREKFGLYGDSYFKIKDFIYMRQNDNSINSLKDIEGKVLAITKGNGRIDDIKKNFPKIKFAFTKDYNEAIDLLLNNKVDAIYDSQLTMDNMLREQMIVGIKGISQRTFKTPSLHMFSRIDKPILQSILQKGLKAISKEKRDEIKNRWLGLSKVKKNYLSLDLTTKQKAYLKNKKEITMCVDPDWMPFEVIKNGKHIGIVADIHKLIQKSLPISIKLIPTITWSQSLELAKQRKCDILSAAASTPQREKYLNFTKTYLKFPQVIATKMDEPFIVDFKDIIHNKIGAKKGSSVVELIKIKYPNINLIEVNSVKEGLSKVNSGELYGFINTIATLRYSIVKYGILNLKVASKVGIDYNINIGARDDSSELLNIMNKAIDNLDKNQISKIKSEWLTTQYEKEIDYALIWKILIVAFIVGIFILYRQILLKKQNQRLEDSINVFEALLDSALEGILIFDSDNICIEVNNKALEIYNADNRSDAIGRNVLNFVSKDSLPIIQKNLQANNNNPYEANFLRKNGETFPALVRGKTIILNGKSVRVSAILDMTDIKNKEKLLIKAKQIAEESTKIKSEFLANMSHEIRTPMNGILGMSHLALQANLDAKQKNYLQKINTSAKSLLGILNDILDFSKIEAGKLSIEKVDFNLFNLIKQIEDLITPEVNDKNLDFKVSYNNCGKNFSGDSLRISQILINLLANAIKFTNHGIVKLNITKLTSSRYKFEVIDTGIGLTKEQQAYLFKSFTQADGSTTRKYGGTGLGLTISRQLVELMNGKIWIESEIDVGSKFIFEIDLVELDSINANSIEIDEKLEIQDISFLSGSEILLVEDNQINQEIIIGLLEDSGINIEIANNGKEAVEKFETNHKKYELILMDLQMPIMDGYEATKIIREIDKDIPIIALTANAMREDIEKTKSLNMNEHLSKPIDIEKLNETLLKYITKKVNNSKIITQQQDDIEIPTFINIDTEKGLSHMAGNKKLYLKVLNDFRKKYSNLNIDILEESVLKLTTHTIKGLSANIGAVNLHAIVSRLDETQDKELLTNFYDELNNVIDELSVLAENKQQATLDENITIDPLLKKELFSQLKGFALKRRASRCKSIIIEIEKYQLENEDIALFEKIKELIGQYQFKESIPIIEEIEPVTRSSIIRQNKEI